MMPNAHQSLLTKLNKKSATICIAGLGYVGLPLALRFTEVGYKVVGVDIDRAKVSALNLGKSYIEHIPDSIVRSAVDSGFSATENFAVGKEADAIIICVPTPLNQYREPDLSFVLNTMDSFIPYLRPGQVVSLESTTWPGTTEEELQPRIEKTGLKVGKDIFLIFSPEREDPGNISFSTRTIPKVCGGITKSCLEAGIALYEHAIDKIVPVSSTRASEMTKLLENIHRSVNIGLMNEMKIVSDRMGIDIHEVIRAAATKPFGFTPYYPGPGLGGHCIPIDPFYLTWKAREYGIHTRFIELAGEINSGMPEWVVMKVGEALNDRCKAIKGSKILVLGITYKKNIGDMRESPSVEVMEHLIQKGANVDYSDPHIPVFPKMRKHFFEKQSVNIDTEMLKTYDAVVLTTDHDDFDYKMIKLNANLIVDTRGVYSEKAPNIVKA